LQVLAFEAADFRNFAHVLVEPHPRFNVFFGDNGQGKTNLLEAVYLLGTLRSFRAARTEEMIHFGAPEARVRARVTKLGTTRLCEVTLSPGHKVARIDGKAARASHYFGGFNVVLFAPEDLRLPRGAPSGRRRFLDRAVWNARPGHLEAAQTYERVLRSRNALLRDGLRGGGEELLAVYDQQLAEAAGPIVAARHALVAALAPLAERAFARVTGGLSLELRYQTRLPVAEDAVRQALAAALAADRPRDRARGATSAGPHTDDLLLLCEGRPAAAYASQGQVRALVLALKIAEIEHLTSVLGDPPVLLLDDVSSELDALRNQQLFAFLGELRGQAFITTTHPAHVLLAEERKDFRVVSGSISG
jgi:DNA replication and repair protein RecF